MRKNFQDFVRQLRGVCLVGIPLSIRKMKNSIKVCLAVEGEFQHELSYRKVSCVTPIPSFTPIYGQGIKE